MNRTDELTDRLIDGTLTDADAVELHDLLAADPGAQVRHLALVRVELVLRGLRTEFDFAEPTVAKIATDRVERTTAAVMSELAHRPVPGRPARRARLWVALAALTAAVFVGVWFARPNPVPVPNGEVPAAPDFARITSVTGFVEVVGPDGASVARADQTLTPDHTLRTTGEESVAVLEFADRTRLEVHSDTAVQVLATTNGTAPRKLLLLHGRVTAFATGRRIVVGAGATEMDVSLGSFSLWSSSPGSARVEPLDGDTRVVRGAPAEPVVLSPGRTAFMRDEQAPVHVERSIRIDTEPRHRLNFMALDAGFTADGEVLAVSGKQWARWRPGAPDPGRNVFLPRVQNDGHVSWLTPDLRAVAVCRVDDREDRVSVRSLPSGEERGRVPVRASEPRFLCVSPDAAWVATTGQKPSNRTVRVWSVDTGTERFTRELNNMASCMTASPDSRWLAVGVSDLGKGTDNAVVVFDAATGDRAFELPIKRKGITTLVFSADGKHLAAGFNGAVQVWDVPGRKLVKTLEGFERVVSRLVFSPQPNVLAAGTQDGQVWVWSADTWRRRQVIETGTRGVRSVAFSADGKLLVTTTNKVGVAVWEVAPEPANEPD